MWKEWGYIRMFNGDMLCMFVVILCKCKLHLVCSVHWATLPNEVFHFVKVSVASCF